MVRHLTGEATIVRSDNGYGYVARLAVTPTITVEGRANNAFEAVFAASDASDAIRFSLEGYQKWHDREDHRGALLDRAWTLNGGAYNG